MTMTSKAKKGNSVGKMKIVEQTFANGDTVAVTDTLVINGRCSQIEFDCAEDTTSSITFTLAVTTADGGTLFTKAAIADNGSTILRAYSMGATDSDFEAFLAAETVTVTITPSGDPGTSGATINVGFYLE